MEFIKSRTINKILPLLVVLAFSIPAILPLLRPGFFPVHDNAQVQRVYEMRQSLSSGMFPVRWINDFGYGFGYPVFNYYAPLPYYFGGVSSLLGLDPLAATKLMFIFPILLSALTMYVLGKEFWGKTGGFVSAIFYVFAPYHALNVYVRGDVGEMWAYAFFPLVFFSLYRIYKSKSWKYVALGGISYALIITSHNLSAFMLTPFMLLVSIIMLYLFAKKGQTREAIKIISVFLLGILLSSFYFIPALLELKYTNIGSIVGGGSDFRNNFVCLNQLWSSPWGFGGSNPGCVDGISFKIGKLHIAMVLLSLLLVLWSFMKRRRKEWLIIFLFLGLVASLFMVLEISRPIWIAIKPMEFIQFPWRYLSLVSLSASLIAGSVFFFFKDFIKDRKVIGFAAIVLILILILNSIKLFEPQKILTYPYSYYTSPQMLRWTTSKISDEYMPKEFKKPGNSAETASSVNPGLGGSVVVDNARLKELAVYIPAKTTAEFSLAYFPAWKGYIDYKEEPVLNREGRVSMDLPQGLHLIDLEYKSTSIERESDALSEVGIVILVAVIILGVKERKNEKKA